MVVILRICLLGRDSLAGQVQLAQHMHNSASLSQHLFLEVELLSITDVSE